MKKHRAGANIQSGVHGSFAPKLKAQAEDSDDSLVYEDYPGQNDTLQGIPNEGYSVLRTHPDESLWLKYCGPGDDNRQDRSLSVDTNSSSNANNQSASDSIGISVARVFCPGQNTLNREADDGISSAHGSSAPNAVASKRHSDANHSKSSPSPSSYTGETGPASSPESDVLAGLCDADTSAFAKLLQHCTADLAFYGASSGTEGELPFFSSRTLAALVRLCGGDRTPVAARIFAIDSHGGSVCVCGHAAAGAPPLADAVYDHRCAWTAVSARRHTQARCSEPIAGPAGSPVGVIYTPLEPDDCGDSPPAAAGIVLEVSRIGARPFHPICLDALDLLRSCLALYSTLSARTMVAHAPPPKQDLQVCTAADSVRGLEGGGPTTREALESAQRAAAEAVREAEGLRARLAEARRACRRLERAQQWLAGARCECLRARLAEFVHAEVCQPTGGRAGAWLLRAWTDCARMPFSSTVPGRRSRSRWPASPHALRRPF